MGKGTGPVEENTNDGLEVTMRGQRYDGWEDMWQQGLPPGAKFDAMAAQPAFVKLLESGKLSPRGDVSHGFAAALVPGCGRGYEVLAIAASGKYDRVIGLDLAPTAVAAARAHAEGREGADKAEFVSGDFFSYTGVAPEGFSLVVDYTFLIALPPTLRPAWARKVNELLSADGVLVTIMFPLKKDPAEGGPPHGMTVAMYEELLTGGGFRAVEGPTILPDELCHPGRGGGNSGIAVWRKDVAPQSL